MRLARLWQVVSYEAGILVWQSGRLPQPTHERLIIPQLLDWQVIGQEPEERVIFHQVLVR